MSPTPAQAAVPEKLATRLITIIVPTFEEVENIPRLIDRVAAVRDAHGLDVELLFMDDDSRDGSEEAVRARGEDWVRIVTRTSDRGLSPSVLDGLRLAKGDVCVCMDADMSHPPEALPSMLAALEAGADFVVGSRYVAGGSTADDWGFFRWLNSRVATLLARPLTNLRDPMAGFFALRRSTFERGRDFNPIGYKIGLELVVKCGCERVVEVPIHFEDRRYGRSKLSFKQQLLYLRHLRLLYVFKFGLWSQLVQFLCVGALGAVVNLAVLTALLLAHVPTRVSVATAIIVSMAFNFLLNRRFSFAGARHRPWLSQFVRFMAASTAGAVINYATTLLLLARVPTMFPQLAAALGIVAGTAFNFLASRYLVFRAAHVRR